MQKLPIESTPSVNPSVNSIFVYAKDGILYTKDSDGVEHSMGGGLISDTYDNLSTLVNNSGLTAGQMYLMTDYVTKHSISDTYDINVGNLEPLILLAVSSSNFDNLVYSTVYPDDTIHFDFFNNICEDYSTPRTGKITYRKDKFNNSCFYDFRNVKFRRWSVDCNVTWSSGSVYTKYSLIKYSGVIYQVTNDTNSGDTLIPSSDSLHYCQLFDLNLTIYWSYYNNNYDLRVGGYPLSDLNIGNYIDCYTFDDGLGNIINGNRNTIYNNEIKYRNTYNNIVFFGDNKFRNVIGENSYNITSVSSFYDNNIGNNFNNNIICNNFNNNNIGNSFYYNSIGNDFYSNTIGNYFQYNIIGSEYCFNKISNLYTNNLLGTSSQYNTIGNIFNNNTIGNSFYYNSIGNNFYSNTIENNFKINTIGDSFQINTITNEFYNNTIGDDFNSNTIGNTFNNNTIGNNFYSNTMGNSFQYNTIGNTFNYNTIENYFNYNTIGNDFNINTIQDKINNIDFTSATHVYNSSYNKTIFKSASGNYKLSYYNESDILTVVDANA